MRCFVPLGRRRRTLDSPLVSTPTIPLHSFVSLCEFLEQEKSLTGSIMDEREQASSLCRAIKLCKLFNINVNTAVAKQ